VDFLREEWETILAAVAHRLPSKGDSLLRDVLATTDGRPLTLSAVGARLLVAFLRQWQRTATKEEKGTAVLGGALGTPEKIAELIERIEREEDR